MSVLPFPEGTNSSADLQVWNNAAYDNDYSEDVSASTQSWGSLKSIFGNPKDSLDSVLGKENRGPQLDNQISSFSSNTPFKPVNGDGAVEKSKNKGVFKKEIRDEKKIDEEIEKIENEISRLSSRLEALRMEKTKSGLKLKKKGRVISAKFMEHSESIKDTGEKKIVEENSYLSGKPQINRRGLSLGPAEIFTERRRGMSMGPSEIVSASKLKQFGRTEITTPVRNRRQSCFLKLQGIDEEKAAKSSSVSPKSRKTVTKNPVPLRQAVTSISRKVMKKDDSIINSVQPKKLFKDGEKSVLATNKKPVRPGRVVASRYNQNTNQVSVIRKRSLPENDKDDENRCEKKRSLSSGKSDVDANECKNLPTESRGKKRWEIPKEIVVHGSGEDEMSPEPVVVGPNLLPRIRIARFVNETPRDSGPAKRVADLIGKKSFFADGEEVEGSVCQTLSYDGEEVEERRDQGF